MGMESLRNAARFGLIRFAPLLLAGWLDAAMISLNTGVAGWKGSGPNVAGQVAVANLGTSPNFQWLPAPAGSQWVSTQPSDGLLPPDPSGIAGTYMFELALATPGLGGSMDFLVAADNQVTVQVFLDGVLIVPAYVHPGNALINSNTSPGCSFLPAGSSNCSPGLAPGLAGPGPIVWGAGGLGAIVIRATVVNSVPPDPSPIGLLLTGAADVTTITPEPSAYAMFSLGSLALIAARRRQVSA
jgi:hypothetical protein